MFIVDTKKQDVLLTSLFGSEGLVFTREVILETIQGLWLLDTVSIDATGHSSRKAVMVVSLRITDWLLWFEHARTKTMHVLWPVNPTPQLRRCVSVRLRQHEREGGRSLLFEMDDGTKAVFEDHVVDSAVVHDAIVWAVGKQRARRKSPVKV